MAEYDAIAILTSNDPNLSELTSISVDRLKVGLALYQEQKRQIALLGSLSGAMQKYLVERGVPAETIFSEEISRDTVGNIVSLEIVLRRMKNWSSIALVSSDFHIDRIKTIREKLYPGVFRMDYSGAKSNGINKSERQKHEQSSLETFNRDFGSVKSWDDIEIIRRLLEVHSLYKDRKDKSHIKSTLMRYL